MISFPLPSTFCWSSAKSSIKPLLPSTLEAEDGLKQYLWTGNVRELKNLIERGVLLADGPTLKLEHLGFETRSNGNGNSHHDDKKLPLISLKGIDFPGVLEDHRKRIF